MTPIHLARPLEAPPLGEARLKLLEGARQGRYRIRILGRLRQRREKRGRGQIGDGESVADEMARRPELAIESIEICHDGLQFKALG